MKRFVVTFEESAQADVRESYEWGCRVWGHRAAQKWVRELRNAVRTQLGVAPNAFPLAPEDSEFTEELHQMVIGRYRLLFTIKERRVHVLHPRGAYVDPVRSGPE